MVKTKTLTFSVSVTVPGDIGRNKVKRLLRRLIQAGLEDAGNAPDDFDDPDGEAVRQMSVGTVALLGKPKSSS